jgi:hypothetical protein
LEVLFQVNFHVFFCLFFVCVAGSVIPLFINPFQTEDVPSTRLNCLDALKKDSSNVVDQSTDLCPWDGKDWCGSVPAKWWLHKSLHALAQELEAKGTKLIIRSGPVLSVLLELAVESHAYSVFWNRDSVAGSRQGPANPLDDDQLVMDLGNFDINAEVFPRYCQRSCELNSSPLNTLVPLVFFLKTKLIFVYDSAHSDLLFDVGDIWKKRSKKPFKNFLYICRVATSLPCPSPPVSDASSTLTSSVLNTKSLSIDGLKLIETPSPDFIKSMEFTSRNFVPVSLARCASIIAPDIISIFFLFC